MLFAVITLGGGLAACTDTPEEGEQSGPATLTAEVTNVVDNSVDVTLTTSGISEYAYILTGSAESAPIAVVIFKDGKSVATTNGSSTISLDNLEFETDYTLHIAAKLSKGGFYDEVVSVDFTTGNYTSDVQIIRIKPDGADIRVKFPDEVKARGNKIKWFVSSVPDNKKWKPAPTGYFTDAELVQQNDNNFPAFLVHKDTIIRICEDNRIFVSPYDGVETEYYPRIAPGEPLVVSIQEVTYLSDDSNSGWGAGWYGTPFSWEEFMEKYFEAAGGGGGGIGWNVKNYVEVPTRAKLPDEEDFWPEDSWHKTLRFTTTPPSKLDAEVVIGQQGYDGSTNLSPKGGKVTFTPEQDVFCYCVSILDHSLYQSILLDWLDGDRSQLQWFITSNFAAYEGLSSTLYSSAGPTSIDIAEWFGGHIIPGGTYHVLVTAMAGKEGASGLEPDPTRQSYSQYTFEIPNYSLPAPEIKVTGLESNNPYGVRFNIKCTNADVAPVEKASFACDYVRSFKLYIDSYEYTYAQLVEMNTMQGVWFNDAVVKAMNSPEGYDIEFESREDAASGLVVMGWNYEGRPSNPDAANSEAYAEARSAVLPDAERVDSPLFEELKGDWTASATVEYLNKNYYPKDENGNNLKDDEGNIIKEEKLFVYDVKTKVTIGDLTYPATLPSEVYDLYGSSKTKEQVDALFEEFKDLADHTNRKIRGQNRLLCQGMDFDVAESAYANILNHQSAWDLFVSPTYSSSSTEDLFYDFGPKWYIQIDKNGNLFIPVNINHILPLTNWQGAKVYFVGYDSSTNSALIAPSEDTDDVSKWPNLPIELSEDKKTMTIKPYVYTSDEGSISFTPSFIIDTETAIYGMIPMNGKIKGDIVLTRGWKEMITVTAKIEGQMTRSGAAQNNLSPIKSANGAEAVRSIRHNRTNLNALTGSKPAVTYTEVKVKPIEREKFLR